MKSFLKFGLVAALVAAMVPAVMAQDGQMIRRGPGMRGGPMLPELRGLDLTEAQRGQVKSIMDSHQNEFRAIGEKIGAARNAMRDLLDASPLDESAVRAKSADVAAADADAAILNAKVRAEVLEILTPEQLKKVKELRDARETLRKQRRPGPRPPR